MNPPPAQPVVLYDGVCGLCQRSVRFLLRHERDDSLLFAALQSETGLRLLRDHNLPADLDAMALIHGEEAWTGADAALRLCRHLKAPYRWLAAFRVIPRPLRERIYRRVANTRYQRFGKTETCPLPAPNQAERFLP